MDNKDYGFRILSYQHQIEQLRETAKELAEALEKTTKLSERFASVQQANGISDPKRDLSIKGAKTALAKYKALIHD